ncbi:MAG: ferredoxin [Candidatus Altiarchaeales archaeon ex4484_2]|nr:MAG: ferredoxin [Candidatus Altiarchaeales archaeon ex4484_2]
MGVEIDKEKCMGCGACWSVCPEGFEPDDDGKVSVKNENADCIDSAAASCPVNAISVD